MLFIEQVYNDLNIKSDYIRCPLCKHGRLCDKPIGEKAVAIQLNERQREQDGDCVILKCPKCSQKFVIHFSK